MAVKEKKKAAKKKAPKAPELPLGGGPGVDPVHIPEVDELAGEYVKWRDKRMAAGKKEIPLKERLIELLHKHEAKIGRAPDGTMYYDHEDVMIVLKPTEEQLTVKAKPAPPEAGD